MPYTPDQIREIGEMHAEWLERESALRGGCEPHAKAAIVEGDLLVVHVDLVVGLSLPEALQDLRQILPKKVDQIPALERAILCHQEHDDQGRLGGLGEVFGDR